MNNFKLLFTRLGSHRQINRGIAALKWTNNKRPTNLINFGIGCSIVSATTYYYHQQQDNQTICEPRFNAQNGFHPYHPLGQEKAPSPMLNRNFIADAVEHALPSVVNISIRSAGPWGRVGEGSGSGFIISEDGFVATNNHVVQHARDIRVTLNDGRVLKGIVHSRDEKSDIALVRIVDSNGEQFPVMKFGSSSDLRVGEFVIALGSPLSLSNTVTAGIVSASARDLSDLGQLSRTDYIQTDAAINQGNSGGPLINLDGQVIGINTMKLANAGGIGFAIPIDTASQVIEQLKENGKVIRPFLGIRMIAVNGRVRREEMKRNTFPEGVESGVLVVDVAPNSPSANAGFQSGDVIIQFDDKPVSKTFDIVKALGFEVGKSHSVLVARKNHGKLTIHVSTTARQ